MKKVIIIYGLIAGGIVSAMMFLTMPLTKDAKMIENGLLVGYSTMIIALAMVFFGIKSFRDNYSRGTISFWKAAQVGILITVIASLMYGLSWEVVYSRTGKEFMEKMGEKHFEALEKEGVTEEKMQQAKVEWDEFIELYKNPFARFGMTLGEILPVGIVITLISAAVLRKKEFLAEESNVSLN